MTSFLAGGTPVRDSKSGASLVAKKKPTAVVSKHSLKKPAAAMIGDDDGKDKLRDRMKDYYFKEACGPTRWIASFVSCGRR